MNKTKFILAAFLGFLIILLCCLMFKTEVIEKDLLGRTNTALSNMPLSDAKLTMDGRDVVLTGTVKTQQIKNRAGIIAGNVWGVRAVHNNLTVEEVKEEPVETEEIESLTKTLDELSVANIEFETGEAVIKPESYSLLNGLADTLKKHTDINILISGHTDPIGNDRMNLSLSKIRAEMVKRYLVKEGINSNRLETEGFGSSKPIAENTTEEGRRKNRRVEFKIIGE